MTPEDRIEKKIREALVRKGVPPQDVEEYVDDVHSYGDIADYEEMNHEAIYQDWLVYKAYDNRS